MLGRMVCGSLLVFFLGHYVPVPAASAMDVVSVRFCESVTQPGFEPVNIRTDFDPQSPEIHAVIQVTDVEAGSGLTASWVAEDAVQRKDNILGSSEVVFEEAGKGNIHLTISKPSTGWPAGGYRLELQREGSIISSVPFTVKAPHASTPDKSMQNAPRLVSLVICEGVGGQGLKPLNITDRFNRHSPEINMLATVKGVKPGTRTKGVLIAVDAARAPNQELLSSESKIQIEGEATVHFRFPRPVAGWPKGHYKVDFYIDDKHVKSTPFAVVIPSQ